jgi:peroxiredoxin
MAPHLLAFLQGESMEIAQTHEARTKQTIGGVVADFELPSIQGGSRGLSAILEGKSGAVIVFWSETCSHCMRYDRYLNEFPERWSQLGFAAIASRSGESPERIRASADERRLVFPILYDSGGVVARQWFVQQTPRVFLIDTVRHLLYRGAIDNFKYPADPQYQPYLEPAIDAFLAGKPIERTETASFGCAVESIYYDLPKPLP